MRIHIRRHIRHRHRQLVLRLTLVLMGVVLALLAGWTIASAGV